MSKKYKLYQDLKNRKKGRSYDELVSLLRKYGFRVDESKGKGSHCPVVHEKYSDLYWTLSRKKPMGVYHVKKVVKLVEEVLDRE
ncbi:hypothetical protein [Salinibacillus xinjiangensis]|uniref:Type II toxin-antitoxin system HicA family toxin n=1 Tax=Salinibacillus xinjiangensis TaxID=1229268 RepID=A0A6G1X744_9BACI|nr:hypothetical protein [Salinibacillus xinjiangensis]MRG86726.1 hypothetical protein [Salinibacillus xinjiangensis]